jgi:hypothetical protein
MTGAYLLYTSGTLLGLACAIRVQVQKHRRK